MRRKKQIQAMQQELALLRQTIVAQEVEKALTPVHAQLDDLQATVDAMAEAEGIEPEKTRKGKKHRR